MLLAPMDGYTDAPFRLICQKVGAEYCYTEMISAAGFLRGTEAALAKAFVGKRDRSGLQLFGCKLEEFLPAVKKVNEMLEGGKKESSHPKSIDLNLGCPVKKVMEMGAGAALMAKPALVNDILNSMERAAILPISAKIRLGISKPDRWKPMIKALNKHSLEHVTVHLRTANQMYSGKAEWGLVPDIVSYSANPIIANGDVRSQEDAKTLIEMGAKNAMAGRAALTNPFLFSGEKNSREKSDRFLEDYCKLAEKSGCFDETQYNRISLKVHHGFEGARKIRGATTCKKCCLTQA